MEGRKKEMKKGRKRGIKGMNQWVNE